MMNTRILTAILMSVGIQVGNGFFIPVCLYFLDVVFARQVGMTFFFFIKKKRKRKKKKDGGALVLG